MIRYSLLCERAHAFESWFRDSAAFEDLASAGHVLCPDCGSDKVHKALMSPSVVTARRKVAVEPQAQPDAPTAQPVALVDERSQKLRKAVRDLHRAMTQNADDVGAAFPAEARRIHEGDAKPRSIYGQATPDDVASLLEEGIPLLPVPVLPDDQN